MTPRPYKGAGRQLAADATRERVIRATRDILMGREGLARLSIDAVAARAGVARMTVYYQFKSKAGLLEAFFDSVAARGPFERIGPAMQLADPLDTLDEVVAIFGEFWDRNRAAHGRLFAAAQHDRVLEQGMQKRNERRRTVMRAVVDRLGPWRGAAGAKRSLELVDALFAMTGFHMFDQLAHGDRPTVQSVGIVQRLARDAVTAAAAPRPRKSR